MKKNQNYYALSVLLSKHNIYEMKYILIINSSIVIATNENEAKGMFIGEIQKSKKYENFIIGEIICIKVPREKNDQTN